jgi:hypothetical protein
MITTNTIRGRAAIVATAAAVCLAVAACGSEQGTLPDRESRQTVQQASANDVAAQVEHRKTALTQHLARPQHAVADDVERLVEQRKSARGTH